MPTKEEMASVIKHIRDVISSDYVVLRGTEGRPLGWSLLDPPEKLFPMLEAADQVAVLRKYVDWQGFTEPERDAVINCILSDESPDFWMDGVKTNSIQVHPGKYNALGWRDDRSFDIHDDTGKIGHITGYMGGPWSEKEFRVTHIEIDGGRSLSPGEWREVLQGVSDHLPEEARLIGGNRGGEGGGLDDATEKLFRLPERTLPDARQRFSDILRGQSPLEAYKEDIQKATDQAMDRMKGHTR
jgi:hypothetical protein